MYQLAIIRFKKTIFTFYWIIYSHFNYCCYEKISNQKDSIAQQIEKKNIFYLDRRIV